MSHGYENRLFAEAADEYYDVASAIRFFDTPVPEGCERWRCILCGWGLDVGHGGAEMVGAICCGGCGQSCLRPIAEWRK